MREVIPREAVRREVIVLDRVRVFALEILVQRSAERHVDDLQPSAQSEDGLPILDRPRHELHLDHVTRRVGTTEALVRCFPKRGRVDVDAARDEHAVRPLVDRAQRLEIL
jgi:hypothetical protein